MVLRAVKSLTDVCLSMHICQSCTLAPFYSLLPVTAAAGGIVFEDFLVHIHAYMQYIRDTWRVFHGSCGGQGVLVSVFSVMNLLFVLAYHQSILSSLFQFLVMFKSILN